MWCSRSRRQLSTQRSATPVGQGLSKEVRTGLILLDRTAAGTSNPYFASWSKIRNLGGGSNGNASRSCCTVHRLVGWFVTLKCRMRRRSWLMTKKQASRWFRRKASQRLALWQKALTRYWTFVKPSNLALEKEMDQLGSEIVRKMTPKAWFEFLLEKYFRWEYTAPNRYASTTKILRSYASNNELAALHA